MTTLRLLFLSLLLLNTAFPQDLYNLFRKHIPAEHPAFTNEYISNILAIDAATDPGLIYFRIVYINNIYVEKNNDQKTNGLDRFNIETRRSVQRRNMWIDRELKKLTTKYKSHQLNQSIKTSLEEFRLPVNASIPEDLAPVDSNKLNYFAVLYYSGNSSPDYNPGTDYLGLRKVYEAERRRNFLEADMRKTAREKGYDEYCRSLFDNWYLFDGESEKTGAADLLVSFFENSTSFERKEEFPFTAGLNVRAYPFIKDPSVSITTYDLKLPVSNQEIYASVFIDLSYQLNLKDYLRKFSYINFTLGAQLTAKPMNKFEPELTVIKSDYNPVKYESYFYQYDRLKNISLQKDFYSLVYLKASTPIFVISKSIVMEAGVITGYNIHSYKFQYDHKHEMRTVVQTAYGPQTKDFEKFDKTDQVFSNTETKFFISPDLSFNISLMKHLILQAGGNIDYFSVSAGYTF